MPLANILSSANVFTFFLLFLRFLFIFTFMPIYSNKTLPVVIKATLAFYITVIVFPTLHYRVEVNSYLQLGGMIASELIFIFISGFLLQLVMHILTTAGHYISFVMGFSMASIMDPSSGERVDILSTFLSLFAIVVLLSLNVHYIILQMIVKSTDSIRLGTFILNDHLISYGFKAITNYFIIGFSMAFPILAISFILDIIFGMLMKTMPQFNVLVIGYPIKIGLSFFILVVVLGSIALILKKEFLETINYLLQFL